MKSTFRDMDKAIQGKPNFTASQSSPRARYIREVIRHGLPPLPLIMRRMHVRDSLTSHHRSMQFFSIIYAISFLY